MDAELADVRSLALLVQVSRAEEILANIRDELCSELVCFHLIRRLGMPGAMSVLEDILSQTARRFSLKRDSVRIGALQEYCVLKVVGWRTQPRLLQMDEMLCPHRQRLQSKASHPISIMKTGGHYDSTGNIYMGASEFLSILKLNSAYYLDLLEPLISVWSLGEPKLITLKSIETFYYPHGYMIYVYSSLGKSAFKMKPSDSTKLLFEFCKDELSHLCEKMLKVARNEICLEDVRIFVGDDLSTSVLVHENVLLVHVIDETFAVQVISDSLEKIVNKRSLQSSLCSSVKLENLNRSMWVESDDENPKMTNTIHLSTTPLFPFDLDSADKWSTEILLRYIIEVVELPQCKDEIQVRGLNGTDFLLQTAKFQSFLSALSHPLHKAKFLQHSDQLLLGVLKTFSVNSVKDSLSNLSSMEIASTLLGSCGVTKIPMFIARKDLNGKRLSRRSEEELVAVLASIDEEEARLVIPHFLKAAEIDQGKLEAGGEPLNTSMLAEPMTHEPSDDRMFISCADSEGIDDEGWSPLEYKGGIGEVSAPSPVCEPSAMPSFHETTRSSASLQCTDEISGIDRIFSRPTLMGDEGSFATEHSSPDFDLSVLVVGEDLQSAGKIERSPSPLSLTNNDDVKLKVGEETFWKHDDIRTPGETPHGNKETPTSQEVSSLGDVNAISVINHDAIIHTATQASAEFVLAAEENPSKEAGIEVAAAGSKLVSDKYLSSAERVESNLKSVEVTDTHDAGMGVTLFEADFSLCDENATSISPNQFEEWESFLRRVRACFARYPPAATITADAALILFIQLGYRVLRLLETLSSANEILLLATASSVVRSASRSCDCENTKWSDDLATGVAMVTCFVCSQILGASSKDKHLEVSDGILYLSVNNRICRILSLYFETEGYPSKICRL